LEGHQGWVTSLTFSSEGKVLLSGGFDGTVRVWDVEANKQQSSLGEHVIWANTVAFPPERTPLYALSAGSEGSVLLWNLHTQSRAGMFGEPFTWHIASSLDFSPAGRHFAVAGWAPSVRIWDAATHQLVHDLPVSNEPILAVRFDTQGAQLLAAGANGVIHVWDAATGRPLRDFVAHRGAARSLARHGETLFSVGDDAAVRQWPLQRP
jgi:WD40 repeat protein